MHEYILITQILFLFTLTKSDDYSVIDLSDILNVDYMPGSLLVLENPEEISTENTTTVDTFEHHGTINDALTTMNFHRKMMNEYLCRNYISEQIISEMRSSRIRRRLGNPMENQVRPAVPFPANNLSIKNNLLEDEGSATYQDWLKKSATLEDIYRHYDSQNHDTQDHNRDDAEDNEEFDGHITGYAYQQPHNVGSPAKFGHSGTGMGYPSYGGGGISGHGIATIHEFPKHHGGHDKDKLADLFDVALTALAYLSFGMFIVQVIMCISMGVKDVTDDDVSRTNDRRRRQIPTILHPNNVLLNDLSRRVLMSIEAALIANQDDGNCLRRTLCENNLYSRNLENNQKYWMPVWSLGMSWLSGKLIQGLPSTTSMLDSLKASILGLGKADCEFIYNKCDLANERQKRRRRRKRNA
ncbi:hypothetical protein RI129_000406 [Pyrocoelia pectoralis]|uniref:Uncharacterized protein n=1 Tax=Pyrocoelia pectoralis TaxID=417401 RepID=A0AAN7VJ44_9COLE